MPEPDVISTQEFWERFSQLAPALSRLDLPPAINLVYGLNSYFGALVDHSVAEIAGDRLSINCTNCRNLDGTPNYFVCQTHLGVIAGTAGALGAGRVAVEHKPDTTTNSCLIAITKSSR